MAEEFTKNLDTSRVLVYKLEKITMVVCLKGESATLK